MSTEFIQQKEGAANNVFEKILNGNEGDIPVTLADGSKAWVSPASLGIFIGEDTDDLPEGALNFYYPSADATKLAGIASGAQVNTINAGGNVSQLVNDARYSHQSTVEIELFTTSDLDAFIVGDAWEFNADINIFVKDNVTFDKAFKNNGFQVHIIRDGFAGGKLTYTGTGALFRGFGPLLGVTNQQIILTGLAATLFATDGMDVLVLGDLQVTLDPGKGQSLGLIDNVSRAIQFNSVTFIGYQTGLIVNCTENISIGNTGFISNTAGLTTALRIGRTANVINLNLVTFTLGAGESCLFLDPDLVGSADMRSLTNRNDFTFYEVGTQGSISAFADAGIGATAISSVTASSGQARFNHAGTDVFVGQQVELSTFVTNAAYNGVRRVSVTGAGFFELEDLVFGTDESGSFLSDSSTVTSAAHGLSELDTLLIENGADYYGGSTIYNVQTNTFQVNRAFTVTKTATWNTGSLTEDDARINATDVGNEADSRSRATTVYNGNALTTVITDGVYVDINIDVSKIIESDENMSRFFVNDFSNNEIIFLGRKAFRGSLTLAFASANTGVPNGDYRVTFQKNDTVPVFATAPYLPLSLKAEGDQVVIPLAITLQPGDRFRPKIAGDGSSTNFVVAHGIVSAI